MDMHSRSVASCLCIFVAFVVASSGPADGRHAERLLSRYSKTPAGRKAVGECSKRLDAISKRYRSRTPDRVYYDDPDVNYLISKRFPAAYMVCPRILTENNPKCRQVYLHIIAGIGWRGAAGYLAILLRNSESPAEREQIINTLSSLGGRSALRILESAVAGGWENESDRALAAACFGISKLSGKATDKKKAGHAGNFRRYMAKIKDPGSKAKLVLALFRLDARQEAEFAVDAMKNPAFNRKVRIELIRFFKDNFHEPCIGVLAGIASEEDKKLALEALDALAATTGYLQYDFNTNKKDDGTERKGPESKEGKKTPAIGDLTALTPGERRRIAERMLAWWAKYGEKVRKKREEERKTPPNEAGNPSLDEHDRKTKPKGKEAG